MGNHQHSRQHSHQHSPGDTSTDDTQAGDTQADPQTHLDHDPVNADPATTAIEDEQ